MFYCGAATRREPTFAAVLSSPYGSPHGGRLERTASAADDGGHGRACALGCTCAAVVDASRRAKKTVATLSVPVPSVVFRPPTTTADIFIILFT